MRGLPVAVALLALPAGSFADPLPSWNAPDAKFAIVAFVDSVTGPASENFVPQADRFAVFGTTDNGAETFSWPDGGASPFRGVEARTWQDGSFTH